MNKLNLQEFCRTCLGSLQGSPPTALEANADNSDATNVKQISILNLLPQLQEMLILLTSSGNARISSLDNDHNGQIYPRSLCRMCYDKLIYLQEFRNLAISSAEIVYKIVNNGADGVPMVKNHYENEDGNDNLISPELEPQMGKTIKSEPSGDGILLPNSACAAISSTVLIKNEIYLGFDKEGKVEEEHDSLPCLNTSINGDVDNGLGENAAGTYPSASLNNAQVDTKYKRPAFKCSRCEKIVYTKAYMYAHIRTEHEGHVKGFLCVECQKAFTGYGELHRHIRSKHKKKQQLLCGINGCGATFRLCEALETHWRVGHNTSSFNDFQELPYVKQQKFNCELCSKTFKKKGSLALHQQRSHSGQRKYVCEVCNVAKVTNTELKTHMQTHKANREKFKCSICSQEFNHKNAISRHVRVVHEGQRRFPCSYCPKRFSTRNTQRNHERLHKGERPFTCELCQRSFTQIEGLKTHMKSHDRSLCQHVCTICSKRFVTKKNLLDHAQRHQSDKPHLCNVCSRGYSSIKDLNAHKQSHTKEELQLGMVRKKCEEYQDSDDGQLLGGAESVVETFLGCSSSMSSFESNSTTTTT